MAKQLVIEIISDAKKFTNGLEQAIETIDKAAKNIEGFEGLTKELNEVKDNVKAISSQINDFNNEIKNGTNVNEEKIASLSLKVESLYKRFDSFRHTFGDLQTKVDALNLRTLESQLEKAIGGLDAFREKYSLLQQQLSMSLNNNVNLNEISNISELTQAYTDAINILKGFKEESKKNKDGNYSKEYLQAASNVYKYTDALIELNAIYNKTNNKNLFNDEKRNKFDTQLFDMERIIGKDLSQEIQKEVVTSLNNINLEDFFKKIVGQVKTTDLTGALKGGSVEIPVKLDPTRMTELKKQIDSDINSLQEKASKNPIQIKYDTDTTELAKNIDKYFSKLKTELKNQVKELNTIMGQLISDTGLKKTEEDFSSIAKTFPEMVRKITEYSAELKTVTTDINTAFENMNKIAKEDNFKSYSEAIVQTADSFKKLLYTLDNISSKISGNGLEGQFEVLREKVSGLDLTALVDNKKENKKIINQQKKDLQKLFSLYSTYQSRGGIRPISDLVIGETNEENVKYFNNAYKEYVKNAKASKKKKPKTDIGEDIFIPPKTLENNKNQFNEILSILKQINDVLQKIDKIKFDFSNVIDGFSNTQNKNSLNAQPNLQSRIRTPKVRPVIPSKKKEEQEKITVTESNNQEKQIIQGNQTIIDSNKDLANNIKETAQAIKQEKDDIPEAVKEKKIQSLMYHLGYLNDTSKYLTHPFGDEIKSWFMGLRDSGRGWGDGTGLYTTKNIEDFSKAPISDKDVKKFYAIDTSELKLYEAHTEETAQVFYNFIHHLEQLCISLGSGFTGFDDNLKDIDIDTLYQTAQSIFPDFKMTFEQFDDFINNMIELVSKSGIQADGSIKSKKMFNFKKEYGADDIKTRFLKQLGYQGTDLSGTSFGGIKSGNVIFDSIGAQKIIASGKQIDEVSQQAKNNILGIKKETKETIEVEKKLSNEALDGLEILKNQKKEIIETQQDIPTSTNQADNLLIEMNQVQEQITQTEGKAEDSEQNIINLIGNIQKALIDLREDLKILAEIIVLIGTTTKQIDFDKIGKINISTDSFDNVTEALKEIIDLIERISGTASKSNLESQFQYIQELYNSMVNDKGNFIVKDNKSKMQLMYSLFDEYKQAGGQMSLHRLSNSKNNKDKLYKYYEEYQSKVKTTDSTKQVNLENEKLKQTIKNTNDAINSKLEYSKVNQTVAENVSASAEAIALENKELEKNKKKENISSESQVSTNTAPTTDFTLVGEAYGEDTIHTQVRVRKAVRETTKEIEAQQTALETIPPIEHVTGEVEGAEKELARIYKQELGEYKKGFKSWEEAYKSMEEQFAEWYASQGYNHTKSVFNVTPDFELKSAIITRENPEDKNIITDSFKRMQNKDTGESWIEHTNIQMIDNEEKRIRSFTKELERNQREREKLSQWIATFNNKTSNNFIDTNQIRELNQIATDASITNEETLKKAERLKSELETVYNDVVNNARRGSSSLSPIPNMMFGEESRLPKLEKAQSTYNKMAIKWNVEDETKDLHNMDNELEELAIRYENLKNAVERYNTVDENGKRIGNVVEVSNAYGDYNIQLNRVTQTLDRIKTINNEINGNKINNLTQWFQDMPDPTKTGAEAFGKIDKYVQTYVQFSELQQELRNKTTNLSMKDDNYENTKQEIHEIILELEQLKKVMSSDSMNVMNQTGEVIKQGLPEIKDVKELNEVINNYIKNLGIVQESSSTGFITDKEGNQFAKFTRQIQDTKGAVTEFEFTYDKAMGTIAVATKKIQEPESLFKQIGDELTTKWRGLFTTLASFTSFYRLWGYFKQGISTVKEFDTALTEMQKVSDNTIQTLQEYQKTTFDIANTIGATALQIQNSTADFMRLGESLKEAAESAKVANILMNVSEFTSIDEATKSLIAMGAAYDELDKMTIIDKLNEVGNNYAISTSEAATALQSSASALITAKNDMDEALALITAGNAVIQDANKVGTGMRTIALRLTGTKSAKEELEEIGEETEGVITSQSKLRDVIKEATAVASNEYKGFDILNENGNYKSTYEIMLGIAEIYDEILETDKKLGRNNANLLLENVAGKVRANIAASIFQNPQLLKDAYKSSQEAVGSAMEENEKYMDSISGHMAQLQNAYQELWANSMNRDSINYFIDLGKIILEVVDDIGLLQTAFVAIVGIKSAIGLSKGTGFASDIIKGSKNAIKVLAQTEGAFGSLASSAISAGSSISGALSTAIPLAGGLVTAIGLIGVAVYGVYRHFEKLKQETVNSANEVGKEWKQQTNTLSDYTSQYEELKKKLDSGDLSEQETIEIKQQILDIQKSIVDEYGASANGIDLINDKLQDQLDLLNNISQVEANKIWQSEEYQKGFQIAQEEILSPKNYKLYATDSDVQKIFGKYFKQGTEFISYNQTESYYKTFGDIYETRDQLLKAIEEIEEIQKSTPENKINQSFEGALIQMRTHLDNINDVITEYESVYLNGLEIKLNADNKSQGSSILNNYKESVANLESAYISGDSEKIDKMRDAFEDATIAKNKFLSTGDNSQFTILFDNIETSTVDAKNRLQDMKDLLNLVPKEVIQNYKEAKKQGEKAYEALGKLQKAGNIDNGNRPIIFWDEKEVKKQEKAIRSWGEKPKNMLGSYSTVYGGSGKFDNVEIAFTPIINDGTGKGKLLNKETVYKYINSLISELDEGWTDDQLLKLDTTGLIIDGEKISNIIADIGDTAVETGEKMHDWQSSAIGYIADYQDIWQTAYDQGMTLDEFIEEQPELWSKYSRAINKCGGNFNKLYQAAAKVKKLNLDRVDLDAVFSDASYASRQYTNAIYDLMNAMGYAESESSTFIDDLISLGIIQGGISDAISNASNSYNQYSEAVSTAIQNLSTLQSVISESDSGKGISNTTLDLFKTAFGDEGVKALEKTANGIRVNRDAIRELGAQQETSLKTELLQALNDQYTALQKVYEGYTEALENHDATTPFLEQEQAIKNNIEQLRLLEAEWVGSTSAYQTWINAQSGSNPQDIYSGIIKGYETVENLIAHGWATDPSVRAYIGLVAPDEFDAQNASLEELMEQWEALDKTIEGTSFTVRDFMMIGEDGMITSTGLNNFEDALKKVQEKYYPDKNWLTYEDGTAIFDFTNGGNLEVANALGIGTEFLDAIISAMQSAGGFEVKLDTDEANKSLEDMKIQAQEAKEALNFNEKINLDTENIDEIDKSISYLQEGIQAIQNNNQIDFSTKTDELEHANIILDYLVQKKNQLIQDNLSNTPLIDINKVEAASDKIDDVFNRYEGLEGLSSKFKDTLGLGGFDFSTIDGLKSAYVQISQELAILSNPKISPNVDTSQLDWLQELLDVIQQKIDLLNLQNQTDGLTLSQYKAIDESISSVNQQLREAKELTENTGMKINWRADDEFVQTLDMLTNLDPDIKAHFGLDPDATTEDLLKLIEEGQTVTIQTETKGALPQNYQNVKQTIDTYNNEHKTIDFSVNGQENINNAIQLGDKANALDGSIVNMQFDIEAEKAKQDLNELEQGKEEFSETPAKAESSLDGTQPKNVIDEITNGLKNWGQMSETADAWLDSHDTFSKLKDINSEFDKMPSTKTIEVITVRKTVNASGSDDVNGTAHVKGTVSGFAYIHGTAFKSGNWGIDQDQTALVGELGAETIVRGSNYFTVGDEGAEFVDLRKGDIIFNHKQTEELFKNGRVTSNGGRGKMIGGSSFVNGSIYYGNAFADRGKRERTTVTVKEKKVGSSSSNTSDSSSSKGNGGNHGGNNNSSDKAKETKNTLDEVEILIARIERQISRLDSTIGNTYATWSKRNQAISRSLEKVTEEIEDQKGAYNTYIKKANSIGLSETWVKKIQSGKLAIEDVNDSDAWDKIQKYKEYYEKALAAQDKLLELEQKQGELYKQRFDNEQAYYEANIEQIQHVIDLNGAYIDKLSEAGYLISKSFASTQAYKEEQRLIELNKEYEKLRKVRDNAVKAGTIKKGSEAWNEMTSAINEVSSAIEEAEQNIISFTNAMREVDWNRWDKTHEAISGIVNELEFLYDLIDEDKMFDEQGNITDYGVTAYALLAQQYDTYIAQANEYAKQRKQLEEELEKDQNNQTLVDELKETIEAEQDAISSAKKLKDSIVDVTENGYKKQIDYIKDLIDDYEELLEAQKDQIDYAKKVADQQKEINKLEKQYRAIQNDTSEEGATKRQKLQAQIKEKKEALQETQEDRRISETKDMLSKFEENFEDFLNNKLKDIETTVKNGIDIANNNIDAVKDTIDDLAKSNGYTISDTLKNSLTNIKDTLVGYFENGYSSEIANNTSTIVEGVNTIVDYYNKAQGVSEEKAEAERISTKIRETGTHVQSYKNEKGQTVNGYFKDDGTLNTKFNGWVNNKTNYYKNGQQVTNAWQTIDGKKYYFNKSGTKVTGSKTIGGKKYYFDKDGTMLTGWRKVGGKLHYYNPYMYTGKQTIGGQKYTFDDKGVFVKKGWKKGTASVPSTGMAWTNEGRKAEAIIRKSDGAILTPLNKGDSVIPSSAMKNMYQALTNPEKYLKQYTAPDIKVIQTNNGNNNSSPANINMQFIANGVQDANKFVNDLMNNKKLEKWIQEVTLGQANGNNSFRKYSYAIR